MFDATIHFVHGNSFPSGTYNTLFQHLQAHYAVQSLPIHCHNPQYPVTEGWPALVEELIEGLQARHSAPVILLGHSMGGILSLMAARQRPDLVECVVLLDAPVVAGWRALLLRYAKLRKIDDKFSPARFSAKRRTLWPDAAAAYQQYADKPMFARWEPQALRDYVEHGLVAHPEGVTLRFNREVETSVYRTLPHDLAKIIRAPFPVPVGFVGGEDSVECRMAGMAATRKLVGPYFKRIEGGHLLPMEAPQATAAAVHDMIQLLRG
jgi:pimeloyl-ACP methyl ester carboxylesterase